MARRGLVSKGMGPQGGGGSALMPKGGPEKPKPPSLLPVAEVARRLRVEPSQVESWMQKNQLRGSDAGIRPYDLNKFKLDHPEEIKKAQKDALQEKQTRSSRKPKKGLFSKFRAIFGGAEGDSDATLARENKQLKAELKKLKEVKPGSKGESGKELEEKVRYLEGKLSETQSLESEVAQLREQLSQQQAHGGPTGAGPELVAELEYVKRELDDARRLSAQSERFREALTIAQEERDQLLATVKQLQQGGTSDSAELQRLQNALTEREQALDELLQQSRRMADENERLKAEIVQASPEPPAQSPLVEELLELQRLNLERFRRLHEQYENAVQRLERSAQDSEQTTELQNLQQRYEALLAEKDESSPGEETVEQLSEARALVEKLRQENHEIRRQLEEAGTGPAEERILELEAQLREALANSSHQQQVETELASLRKGVQVKENQVQKMAGKLAENEKRLSKAMQESDRLTELLIERENRLRELSSEFEQEYRDKIENLDRQVSGLQWKLSLREERIAHLESELLRKGG